MRYRRHKIEALTIKISEEMLLQFDYKTDTLYLRGFERGFEQGFEQGRKEERTKNVLSIWQKGIEPPMIANLLNLLIEEVEQIIAEFQGKNADKGVEK